MGEKFKTRDNMILSNVIAVFFNYIEYDKIIHINILRNMERKLPAR